MGYHLKNFIKKVYVCLEWDIKALISSKFSSAKPRIILPQVLC